MRLIWRRITNVSLVLVLAVLSISKVSAHHMEQETQTVLRIAPATNSVTIGDEFKVEIWVDNVENLYGADIQLTFDPSAFEVVGEQMRLRSDFLLPQSIVRNTVDNTNGTIWYAVSQINPTEPVSGSGVLFEFDLMAKKAGVTLLVFTNHQLAAIGGEPIENTTYDAVYTIEAGEQQSYNFLPLIMR